MLIRVGTSTRTTDYTVTSDSSGHTATKRTQELVGYTATNDTYGWVRTGSQQVGENFKDYCEDMLDGTRKYAYSEKTP